MKILTLVIAVLFCSNAYAISEWIPYQPKPVPPQVYVPSIPSITYSTQENWITRPITLSYEWVPYYSTQTLVLERQGLLCKYRTVMTQPTIKWVYQPVWK